jgi:hypothetical protein
MQIEKGSVVVNNNNNNSGGDTKTKRYTWGLHESSRNSEVVNSAYHYNTDGKEIESADQAVIQKIIELAVHFFSPKNDTPSVCVCTNEQKNDKGDRLIEYVITLNVSRYAVINIQHFAILERQFIELTYTGEYIRLDEKTGTFQITFVYPSVINGIIMKEHVTLLHSVSIPLTVKETDPTGPIDEHRENESVYRPRKMRVTKKLNGEVK